MTVLYMDPVVHLDGQSKSSQQLRAVYEELIGLLHHNSINQE